MGGTGEGGELAALGRLVEGEGECGVGGYDVEIVVSGEWGEVGIGRGGGEDACAESEGGDDGGGG